MIIKRVGSPVYQTRFKTRDILAKDDVNRSRHIHNQKIVKKELRAEAKNKVERNFNIRVKKHVEQTRSIVKEAQKEVQSAKLQERYLKSLNVV